jgi:hypothetical protein
MPERLIGWTALNDEAMLPRRKCLGFDEQFFALRFADSLAAITLYSPARLSHAGG